MFRENICNDAVMDTEPILSLLIKIHLPLLFFGSATTGQGT